MTEVISLFDRKEEPPTEGEQALLDIEERNKKNKARMERERQLKNKQVLAEYRIRSKK